jgi:acyl transferase domain-containing protein
MGTKKEFAISRREFARRAAMISAAASLTPAHLLGAEFPVSAPQVQQPPNLPKLSPESQTEVESRLQAILNEYGNRLSNVQKADLHRLCRAAQPALDRLRAYATENGDAPALYLRPLMEREKKPSSMPATAKPAIAPKKS